MSIRNLIVMAIAAALFTDSAVAHVSHTSVSEVEWNPTSQRFEVSMRLHIVDLEDSISVVTGKKFRLEGNKLAPELLTTYLSKRFAIRSEEQQTTKLHWVGMELELHDVWVYFELEVQPGAKSDNATAGKASTTPGQVETWDQLFEDAKTQTAAKPIRSAAVQMKDVQRLHVESSVLFETQREQKNVVSVTIAAKTNSVVLVPGNRQQVLDVVAKRKWHVGQAQQG